MNQLELTRILIAERQAAVRAAVSLFVEKQPGLEMVGEAVDAQELLTQIEAARPDVILLDWGLSDGSPHELVQSLHQFSWQPRVVVLDVRPESLQAALAAGADAFVCKSDPPVELLTVIRAARPGETKDEPTGCARFQE